MSKSEEKGHKVRREEDWGDGRARMEDYIRREEGQRVRRKIRSED